MTVLTLLSLPKKSLMFSIGRMAMWARPSRISLSSDSVANSSLKKGRMMVQHSRFPEIFFSNTWESNQVLADPLSASPKLSKAILSDQLFVYPFDKFIGCDGVHVCLSPELRQLVLLDLDSHASIRTSNHLCLHNWDIVCRLVYWSDQRWLWLL